MVKLGPVLMSAVLLASHPALGDDPNQPLAAPAPGIESEAPRSGEPADDRALLANLYDRLAKSDGAEAAGATAIAIERLWLISGSDTIDLLLQRALEAQDGGEKDLALTLLDNVIDLAPQYAEGYVRRAYLRAESDRLIEAEDDLVRALAIDPNHFRAWEGLGHILQQLQQKSLALKAYRQLLEVYPANEEARRAAETLEREVEGQKI
jgi:tetratricopeptide (TPR) repeat protein